MRLSVLKLGESQANQDETQDHPDPSHLKLQMRDRETSQTEWSGLERKRKDKEAKIRIYNGGSVNSLVGLEAGLIQRVPKKVYMF